MGQKTNPTALRLETTNQHYNSNWYSNRFYAFQLHSSYKISSYIAKIFHRIKKVPYFRPRAGQRLLRIITKPLIYAKASHRTNQIFCIFPKFKKKYSRKKKNYKNETNQEKISRQLKKKTFLSILCALAAQKDVALRHRKTSQTNLQFASEQLLMLEPKAPSSFFFPSLDSSRVPSLRKESAQLALVPHSITSDVMSDPLSRRSKAVSRQGHDEAEQSRQNLSLLVRALFYNHSWEGQEKRKQLERSPRNTPRFRFQRRSQEKKHLSRLEEIMESNYHLSFAQSLSAEAYLPTLECGKISGDLGAGNWTVGKSPEENVHPVHHEVMPEGMAATHKLLPTRLARCHNPLNHNHLFGVDTYSYGEKKSKLLKNNLFLTQASRLKVTGRSSVKVAQQKAVSCVKAAKLLRLYLFKVAESQQNSQFLAQRISNGLRNRFTFQKIRRQIIWDLKKSKYVKGVRVTLSGRVEGRSKKAQKAQSRSFQWGQTELHVLSSLVQFTGQELVTPRGKIGIKVWICYGS